MGLDISVAGVSERDIDLLLLEEFQSESEFHNWFVARTLGPSKQLGECVSAARSVTHSTGESDLEVTFSDLQGKTTCLLIENKVNAGLQPRQAARYHVRGASYVAGGKYSRYYTVIVAPRRYFGSSGSTKGFHHYLEYEVILKWF